jgi:hypothetical protein
MIQLTLDDRIYHIEFRHVRRDRWPGSAIGRRAPVRAITTCVILFPSPHEPWQTIAIGTALCANEDAFSRQTGRHVAFSRAVNQCGALRGVKMALTAAYLEHDAPPCKLPRPQLTADERIVLWQAGWEKRKQRELARAARSAS